MNTIDEAIEILKAMKEGKKLQLKNSKGKWVDRHPDTEMFMPDFCRMGYRIKPEPREIWVNVYPDGRCGEGHNSKREAEHVALARARTLRFREVIEE